MPRARSGILHAASQNRDRNEHSISNGPGSAAHYAAKSGVLRCVRGTQTSEAMRHRKKTTAGRNDPPLQKKLRR
jgi:hypothetical protein